MAAPTISTLGTPMSSPPTLYGPGWNIGGGGTDVDAAMQWLVNYVRGGSSSSNKIDIVVLRCAGTDGYNAPWYALSGVNSITTVVGTSASDFNDSRVSTLVHNAGVVFLAGGDQANYVNYIKGTATDTAIQYVLSHGGGIGGTSAGTAIQGPFIFDSIAADNAGGTNVASPDALANPYESTISFTYGWYAWSHFENILCEPHFGPTSPDTSNKDRMGRIMAFLARQVQDGRTATAWGMGVNAGTSLVVDKNGLATVMGTGTSGDGIAYLILLDHMPETCVPGTPLTCSNYKIWMLTEGQTFDLAHRPTCNYYLGSVTSGSLSGNYYSQGALITNCDTAPTITAQPASQTVSLGQTATFSVVATGTSLSYQWRRNGAAITGATSATYTTPAATSSDNGAAFSVVVSNTSGSVTSSSATLTVGSTPPASLSISSQPTSASVSAGSAATFSVGASGATYYQWFRNGLVIAGATASTYTTPATASTDNGARYFAVVSNTAAGLASSSATLTVNGGGGGGTATELVTNGGFESGSTGWTATSGVIGTTTSSEPAYAGSYRAYVCGRGRAYTDYVYQSLTIPNTATSATLTFYLHIDTAETGGTAYDTLQVQVRNSSGTVLKTLATCSNLDASSGYSQKTFDLSSYKGQSIQLYFLGTENSSRQTSFVLDNVSLIAK
jgi:cyanophycinase-like exopeptidase